MSFATPSTLFPPTFASTSGAFNKFPADTARGPCERTGSLPIVVLTNGLAREGSLQRFATGKEGRAATGLGLADVGKVGAGGSAMRAWIERRSRRPTAGSVGLDGGGVGRSCEWILSALGTRVRGGGDLARCRKSRDQRGARTRD